MQNVCEGGTGGMNQLKEETINADVTQIGDTEKSKIYN